ncbi:MAG: DUF3106 domain-containing protein, partial [Acidobacteriota bacterium]|nr:DUF3106 domain-containing protein [Acidobacteriota bacterium]
MRLKIFATAAAALLLMGTAAAPASAQWGARWRARAVAQRRADGMRRSNAGRPNVRNMEGLPPKWVEKLRDLPPSEQERFLRNNERFRNLPPERQEQIRRNLQRWNNLT